MDKAPKQLQSKMYFHSRLEQNCNDLISCTPIHALVLFTLSPSLLLLKNVLHRVRMLPITRWLLVLAWSASQAYALDRDQDRTHLVRKERYNLLDTLRSVLKAQ